jgi:hypothetical protein
VSKKLKKKYPAVFQRMSKKEQEVAEATHQQVGDRHVFQFSDRFKTYSKAYRLGTLLHETTHMRTAIHFDNPQSDVVLARGIELVETSFEDYEYSYGFDELEARIKELAVLTQAASKSVYTKWDAENKRNEIRKNILFQRLAIRKALEWLEDEDIDLEIEVAWNFVGIELKNCKRRTFCKMEIPMRAGTGDYINDAEDYIRRILAVRSNSLDILLETMRRISKRLDDL